MGYDMCWRNRELAPEQEAALAQARAEWHQAIEARD